MSLRILLADESATIKKVIQLTLQDFAVEIKSVTVGIDVLQVARVFQPNIIFCDILLAKRNGYEVCSDIKSDALTKKIPVVLMWSSFMEFDDQKAKTVGVDRKLEKPFDAETLRSLVKELVPELNSNVISNFLSFPKLPEFDEPKALKNPNSDLPAIPVLKGKDAIPQIPATDFEEPEDFQQVPLPQKSPAASKTARNANTPNSEQWVRKELKADLTKFKIELPSDNMESFEPEEYGSDLTLASIALSSEHEEIPSVPFSAPIAPKQRIPQQTVSSTFMTEDEPTGDTKFSMTSLARQMGQNTNVTSTSQNRNDTNVASNIGLGQVSSGTKTEAKKRPSDANKLDLSGFDPQHLESILREQVREVLETIAWKVIPDVAERIIREEVQKLLKESERL